ncbi:DUF3967 domain-containing protein [Neobacillus drentensis]|uniref:DUF3967 domain-containing protein n=1 Tax=Neobacillus drentensis TaxID=220684 RepID=UPI002FFE17C9
MSAGDVCTLLQVKESTLRKYALLLQDAGYHFATNDKGQRAYYNRDVITLKKLLEIKSSPNMTLEQSVNAVMTWIKQSGVSLPATEIQRHNESYNDDIKELREIINQQNILLQKLIEKMDQQQKYIDERLEQRDRTLIESLRESQEVKQQLLQIAAAHEEEKKKGFIARLFGR